MNGILLTQNSTFIIGQVAWLLGKIMEGIFEVLNMIGIPNIGLAIILFTIVVNLLMMPLTIKQQKFSKLSAKMNPEIQAIQAKYKNRKDQDAQLAQNQEIQAVYAKYGVSPTGSCLYMLIQMPILFALYRVIYAIPAYVGRVKEAFFPLVDNIIDTAGIRDTDNVIEQIGVEKSKTLAMEADLVLLMFDGSRELTDEDRELIKLTENKKSIVLVNKLDLEQKIDTDELEKLTGGFINISVKADKGVEKLYDAIKSMFIKGDINVDNQVLISGERNKASLVKAKNSLENVIETIANGMPEDFMIMDLTDAYEALGEISGETLEEDIIDRIFSEFCLGK